MMYNINKCKVVETDKKQRYTIKSEDGIKFIRANQGHSIPGINENMIFKPINSPEEIPTCIHGTYYNVWDRIKYIINFIFYYFL